jgi:hypothetical protein
MALPLRTTLKPEGVEQGDLVRLLQNMRDVINELQADHANLIAVAADSKTLVNDIRAKLQGDYIMGVPALGEGSNADDIASAAFYYSIGGSLYLKAAVTDGTAPGTDVILEDTFGAVALDIGVDGTLDAISADDNATGYASAVLAVAGIPVPEADHVRVGWVTVIKSDGDFTFGTTDFTAANVTAVFTDADNLATALGAAVTTSAPAALTNDTPITLNQG